MKAMTSPPAEHEEVACNPCVFFFSSHLAAPYGGVGFAGCFRTQTGTFFPVSDHAIVFFFKTCLKPSSAGVSPAQLSKHSWTWHFTLVRYCFFLLQISSLKKNKKNTIFPNQTLPQTTPVPKHRCFTANLAAFISRGFSQQADSLHSKHQGYGCSKGNQCRFCHLSHGFADFDGTIRPKKERRQRRAVGRGGVG